MSHAEVAGGGCTPPGHLTLSDLSLVRTSGPQVAVPRVSCCEAGVSILRLHSPPPRAELASACLAVATGSSPGVILTTYSRLGGHLDLLGTPEAIHTLPAPTNRLSAKQLALRRGAALGVAVGSLIVGLVLRVLTARP